jgi:hypothetical protein
MADAQQTKQMSGEKWLSNIIGAVWGGWYMEWEQLNSDLYGYDAAR